MEIVTPKIIITLGVKAFRTVKRVYNIKCSNYLRDVVKYEEPILINETKWFPVYHIGKLAQSSRPLDKQRQDWVRIKNFV
ncbi:hypothetical protein FO507_00810 [Bacillus mojavensis]|nr:hypothetical protein [Bacillus mojavensis]